MFNRLSQNECDEIAAMLLTKIRKFKIEWNLKKLNFDQIWISKFQEFFFLKLTKMKLSIILDNKSLK
jgi:hypothetical protein